MSGELAELEVTGEVALLRLNRPAQLNALTDELLADADACLDAVESRGDVRAVVVTGNGRAFCAGADLSRLLDRLDGRQDEILAFVRRAGALFARVESFPVPVVAAVNGAAVAGGFELVLASDVVVAAEGALLGDGHLRYGVFPGGGGAVRLERKIPANVARRLLLTGDLEPAERFQEWGLVDEVVPAEAVVDRAVGLAGRIARRSPLGVRQTKRVALAARDVPVAEALEAEFQTFADYVVSADLREGLTAFRDKRTPRFVGH
ncbi:enoyl-CoA hydratase/isomerase family protein [Pseudonocardia sp. ICBG1122]|nr:enoyl-CoA hydratase/isomerase family protein [Pseudonocardia pini]